MVRIAIVIPYASMANLAWDVFQEHTEQMRLQALDVLLVLGTALYFALGSRRLQERLFPQGV